MRKIQLALLILVAPSGAAWRAAVAKPAPAKAREAADENADGASGAWPFIRGPNFDGHSRETGLVDSFPPAGPPVLWTRPLGAGYSGFTAERGRVYTQYQTLGGQYVVCLDAATGETAWEHRYDLPYDPAGMYPGPRATPTLAGGRVYFASPSGLVGCLDAETGRPAWSLNIFERFAVEPVEFGYSCSPVVVDDMVLLPVGKPDASLAAFDAGTGRVLWHAGDDAISHVPAMPIQWNGRRLVVGYFRNALDVFDLATGEILWRIEQSHGYDEHAAWPIYSEPYLWTSGPFRAGSELIELVADPPGYRSVWKDAVMSNDVCSSVLVEGSLYGFDLSDVQTKPHRPSRGQFRCIDFLTGHTHWSNGPDRNQTQQETAPGTAEQPAVGQASVLYADDKLILFNDLGELILARANPAEYEELGRASVLGGEICWTPPTLFQGRLYVRNQSRAVCVVLAKPGRGGPDDQPRLTIEDIPKSAYRDWAAVVLAVEPEFAMDVPSLKQLRLWFAVSLGGIAASAVVAGLAAVTAARIGRRASRGDARDFAAASSDISRPGLAKRRLRGAAALLFGLCGTTFISAASRQFIFTWPLCLFIAFQAAVNQIALGAAPRPSGRWRGRLVLGAFLATCLAYFLVCRRLSLATEWVFLSGFLAAVPLLLWARRRSHSGWLGVGMEWALSAAAFTAYYWASVGVLMWRYRH